MKTIKKLIVLAYVAVFLYDLAMFTFTRDIYYGIWAVLLSLGMHVEVSAEIKRKADE